MTRAGYWLLGGLGATVVIYYWTRTKSGQAALGSTTADTIIEDIVVTAQKIENVILPAGLRNKNPGNIFYNAANQWQGQTGEDSTGRAQFSDMIFGIRAASHLLLTYYNNDGLTTVDQIIRRWSATDQDAYVADVAAALQVDPHESIDVSDTGTRFDLLRAIFAQENGPLHAATISDATVTQGMNA